MIRAARNKYPYELIFFPAKYREAIYILKHNNGVNSFNQLHYSRYFSQIQYTFFGSQVSEIFTAGVIFRNMLLAMCGTSISGGII